MSAKLAKPSKKAAKVEKKPTKAAPIKASAKEAPKTIEAATPAMADPNAPQVDLEELEEQQAEAASASANSSAAALAAVTNPGEMSASFKNFRHHPDMENFYRFIYDNDLRHEALEIIDEIMLQKKNRKLAKHAKTQAH